MNKEACAGYCWLTINHYTKFSKKLLVAIYEAIEEVQEIYTEEEAEMHYRELCRKIKEIETNDKR